jgi:hypothetical protein
MGMAGMRMGCEGEGKYYLVGGWVSHCDSSKEMSVEQATADFS